MYEIPLDNMNFEKYTWIILIEAIQNSNTYSKDMKIGIVVDSYANPILNAIAESYKFSDNIDIVCKSIVEQCRKIRY